MKNEEKNTISRREFIKRAGAGVALTSVVLAGCDPKNNPVTGENRALGEIPTDQMTLRTNHNSGDRVSILGYGCMRWPTINTNEGEQLDQQAINRLVDYAIEHGVNYFDTSPNYCRGRSEEVTGIALSRHPRDKYFVATKLSNFDPASQTREGSMAMYRNSFRQLQVDTIDYYLLHAIGMGGEEAFNKRFVDNGMLDFLMEERKAGRIRNLGFSFHADASVFDFLMAQHEKYHWDFVQIQMNYVDWHNAAEGETNAEYLYDQLAQRNIPVVIMEPLLGGRLSDVPNHISAILKQRDPDRSVASWAFRFAGSFPSVLTVLSGMTYMEHLQDNILSYAPLDELNDEDKAFLEENAQLLRLYPTIPCTGCNYCMPCPYGIDIPATFAHYNKCVNEGNVAASSQDENYRKARRAFLIGYDRSVPKLRQASHCIACGKCMSHCPQRIRIPQQMQRIDKFVEDLKQGREF